MGLQGTYFRDSLRRALRLRGKRPAARRYAGRVVRPTTPLIVAFALFMGACGDDDADPSANADAGQPQVERPTDGVVCPKAPNAERTFEARRLLGKPLNEAESLAARYNCQVRVVAVQGSHHYDGTDLGPARVNVVVDDQDRVVGLRGVF